nr:ATP-binding protein [Lysinibacillus timonensis]
MKSFMYSSVAIVLLLLTYLMMSQFPISKSEKVLPEAENGVIDLRNFDFHQGAVELKGEWEFISNSLVDVEEFDEQKSTIVKVPNLWKNYSVNGVPVSKFTSGTYRLKVLLDDTIDVYGIKTTSIRMSNATYINGEYVGGSGRPAEDETYSPHNTPFTAFFSPNNPEIEILIHVANFDYASGGGIVGAVYFGDQNSILNVHNASIFYDWVTITAFLTMFVYFLGSYLQFRKDIELLYFALFCFSTMAYSVSHGEKVLLMLIPEMAYGVFERIQILSSIMIGVFLLLYFNHALRNYIHKRIVKIFNFVGVLLGLSAFLPIFINSQFQGMYSIYLFMVIAYIISIQIKAIKQRAVGTIYLIIASIAILIYFIVATLNTLSDYQLSILPPLLPFICLLMLALFISNRFTHSFLKKEELTNALLRIDKLKDEFVAKTSHEFRTPLHGITAISQSLLEKDNSISDEDTEKINLIRKTAERLSHLVNDILDHSKIQQGELKLTIAPVDLYSITHVITGIFHYMVKKDIEIHNNIARGIFVLADENRLRQILYNLIDNAAKYTNQGRIDISASEINGIVTVEVSDTGIGIPEQHINNLFNPFQQFDSSIGGTGLGLSVVKQLVELQKGEIWVDSEVGKGTSFVFSLPIATPVVKQDAAEAVPYYPKISSIELSIPLRIKKDGKKILVADDDHVNLKVMIEMLETEQYSIIAVDHGQAVLDEIKHHPDIDLVVLDIMMPGLSGYEVSIELRKMFGLSELPILMLTAAITPEDMIAAFQSGANDFLHKPFVASELKTRIRNLLLIKESANETTKMEIAFLQAQIKPHFIYNVLNTILSLSYLDIDKTRAMIKDFATFLRGSFSFENTSSLGPLKKELALVQSYVNIHQTRFPNKIEWIAEVDDDIESYLIPPLLIQPIIENAILHGLKNVKTGGQVSLSIKKKENFLSIIVKDNGIGISEGHLKTLLSEEKEVNRGIGLKNVAKRIKYFQNTAINISSNENVGTAIEIIFPIINSKVSE